MARHDKASTGESPRSVTIDHLGAGGDGVAQVDDERWFVARGLPGETVLARPLTRNRDGVHAEALRIEVAAAERVAPPCPHFADSRVPCGGCCLQHLARAPYTAFKRELITRALVHRGLTDAEGRVGEPIVTPERSRRRVTLTAIGSRDGAVLGFHQRRSKRVVDLADCVIALPAITDALPALRAALGGILRAGERASLGVTALDSGLAIDMTGPLRYPGRQARERLATLAERLDVSRLAWRPHPAKAFRLLAERRPASHRFAGVPVTLPAGAFLQATAEGERAIRDTLLAAVEDVDEGAMADLYAGCGSLALPLAGKGHRVWAVEGDRLQVRALAAAAGDHALAVRAERRDLDRQPPSAVELAALDAVVLDPPRAGARAVAAALARSRVPTVVAVSCHPGTFARDARILLDGGYALAHVQPIDQFLHAAHVELVAVFRR